MEDPALLAELVDEGADAGGGSADHDHLGAVLVREVHVGGGENAGVVAMLDLDQAIRELTRLMVVNQRNGANDLMLLVRPLLLDEALANEVADEFGAIGVLTGLHQPLEALGQRSIERHAQARECGQRRTSDRFLRAATHSV